MEDLIASEQRTQEKFLNCWFYWTEFTYSPEFTMGLADAHGDQMEGQSVCAPLTPTVHCLLRPPYQFLTTVSLTVHLSWCPTYYPPNFRAPYTCR